MAQKFSIGIDIGTQTIKIAIAEKPVTHEPQVRIVGTIEVESRGFRYGYIVSRKEAVRAIENAVHVAEKTLGMRIKRAYISIGGASLSAITSVGTVAIADIDTEITEDDEYNATLAAESEVPADLLLNKRIWRAIPLSYKIDDKELLAGKPTGMSGRKLEVKTLVILCQKQYTEDLFEAVDGAGIDMIDAIESPFAAVVANLPKSQRVAGCILINIGAETTSFVVYENDVPISLEVLNVGGTDITNDIALGLRIPIDEAERLKRGARDNRYPKKKLDDIINTRLSDIFRKVESHLKKIGRNGLLPAGVILTGGGAATIHAEDIARTVLKLPTRTASLASHPHIQEETPRDPSWSVAYGLALSGFFDEENDAFGFQITRKTGKGFKKMADWFTQFLP